MTSSTSPLLARELGFDRLLIVAERLEHEPLDGVSGQWSVAHVFEHCAQSIEYSMKGYPSLRSGVFRATIGKIAKRKFLRAGSMWHDTTAPVAGAPALAETSLTSAARRLRDAVSAFRSFDGTFAEHLAYGPCTRQEYEALHVMHFLDHMQKLQPLATSSS